MLNPLDEPSVDTQSPVADALEPTSRLQCRGIWAVAHTHPQAEPWAARNLRHRGFVTFLPTFTARIRSRTTTRLAQRPLFPTYLFVQHDNPDLWRPIRETPGIQSVLICGNRIQYARKGAVEALQATEPFRRCPTPPEALWSPGAPCRLAHGPFHGLDGVVMETTDDIALVAVLMLGQLRNIAVKIETIVAR